jgi:iron complex outermembrane receptor protein
MIFARYHVFLLLLATCAGLGTPAFAQSAPEKVVVYGTLTNADIALPADNLVGGLQSLSPESLGPSAGTVLDNLNQAAGVSLSDSQGNSLFQDLRYHGFSASPLQGTAEGLAVYQNGVRLNEAFGDTVNWDLIPQNAIARLDVWSGNPVFGLNALGGAASLVMKNGFSQSGGAASLTGGSYGQARANAEYGARSGNFAFYGDAEGLSDKGWRLHSPSAIGRLYGDLGWRAGASEVHLVLSGAQSHLSAIGPTPVEMLQQNSASVFTWPQITRNRSGMVALNGQTYLSGHWQVQASLYARSFRQSHLDGNIADFERCSTLSSFAGKLCLQDDAFGTPPGGKTTSFRDQFVLLDSAGSPIAASSTAIYGTLDRTNTDAVSQGATLQLSSDQDWLGHGNYLTLGGSLDHSALSFRSMSALADILADLDVIADPALPGAGRVVHTKGNLGYAPVDLAGTTDYYGLYGVDAFDLTKSVTLTAGFRLNAAQTATRDRSGAAAELSGMHGYTHFNPLAGISWRAADTISLFASYAESNRAPTPLELDCADASKPCLLEGSLVSDPPLKQVVARSWQAGVHGGSKGLSWSVTLYRADSNQDIVALASTIQGRGFFANVPSTRRQGADLSAGYQGEDWSTHISYSWLDATYQFTGTLASPNNPMADTNGDVMVTPGRHIPLNPPHRLNLGGEMTPMAGLKLGGDIEFASSQYFAGDDANQNARLPSTITVNLDASYDLAPNWQLVGAVKNLFNRHGASYGAFFQPGDTAGLVAPALSDPRLLTLQQPLSFELGIKTVF